MDDIRKQLEKHFDPIIAAEILDLARVCREKKKFLAVQISNSEKVIEVQLFPMNNGIPARRKNDLADGTWGVKIKTVK